MYFYVEVIFVRSDDFCQAINNEQISYDYSAPETLGYSCRRNQQTDIWCIGVLIFELLANKAPFNPVSEAEEQNRSEFLKEYMENVKVYMPAFLN